MIIKFIKRLFCIPHRYECEMSILSDEWYEVCSKCEKTRKIKKVIM